MKNKEADTELESRLLEILVHPCRIEDIRRELPNAGKNNLKNALDALIADGRVMKNKKNRFAPTVCIRMSRTNMCSPLICTSAISPIKHVSVVSKDMYFIESTNWE